MDLTLINRRLKDNYGQDFLGQAIYKIVWSDDQTEKRKGYFEDYAPGTNILLRRVNEIRVVKKYPYLDPQYVLEKLFTNKHNTEILDNDSLSPMNCTYEPMWAFGYEGKTPRPIVWRAIELLMLSINNPEKLTPSEMDDTELAQAKEDERIMFDLLNTHIKNDAFHSSVKDGDTILMNDATRAALTGGPPKQLSEL